MRNRWHLVGHVSELANPGDFVVLPFATDREIVLSNIDGDVVAWDNRCPHRGARIYTEPRGNRAPVCGYHGRCARAQDVHRFHVTEVYGGFLFVCTDPHAPGVPAIDSRTFDFLEETPPLRFHSEIRAVYSHDWTVAVENALDNEHVPLVHGDSLSTLGLTRAALHCDHDGSSLELFVSAQADRLDRVGKLFDHRLLTCDYAHAHLFPYGAIATTRGWTYALQNYFPRSDGGTTFVSRLFVQDGGEHETARLRWAAAVANMNERVFAEDGAICDLVQVGFTGNLGPRDDRIRHFRTNLRPVVL